MKKIALSINLLMLFGILQAQNNITYDTVRYGDPWYGFNPVTHIYPPETQFDNGAGGDGYFQGTCAPYLFGNHCGTDNTIASGALHEFQAYANNNYTIYGIALTAHDIPDSDMVPELLLLHGFFYHLANFPYTGFPPQEPGAIDSAYIYIDSIGQIDTLNMWRAPMRRCYFDYHFDYDFSTHTSLKDDSVFTSNCYEFFFDTPISLRSEYTGDTVGILDTFLIGGQYCSVDSFFDGTLIMCGQDSNCQQPWLALMDPENSGANRYGFNAYYSPLSHARHSLALSSRWAWGTVFPIIKLRCVEPRLRLAGRGGLSATVAWRQNDTPEQYQLSITPWDIAGTDPDSGAMFYTTDTTFTFTNLQPDTRYSVWVRKACRYTTSAYDTIVWSDWSNEVVFMAVGIDEVEADGVRITSQRGSIVVEGAEGREVRVYDMLGREVTHSSVSVTADSSPNLGEQRRIAVPAAGIYMVRVGELPTRKVAVLR